MQFLVDTKEHFLLDRALSNMEAFRSLKDYFLCFGKPLVLQNVLAPRRHHDFDSKCVESTQIFVKSPAERAVSQVNHAYMFHGL